MRCKGWRCRTNSIAPLFLYDCKLRLSNRCSICMKSLPGRIGCSCGAYYSRAGHTGLEHVMASFLNLSIPSGREENNMKPQRRILFRFGSWIKIRLSLMVWRVERQFTYKLTVTGCTDLLIDLFTLIYLQPPGHGAWLNRNRFRSLIP